MKRSKWRQRLPHGLCDPVLRSWLTEPDSLTARCQRASSSFRVRLLRFAKGAALADEAVEGGVGRERAWVREVALECDVRLVRFAQGQIEFSLAPGASPQLAPTLMRSTSRCST